MSDKPMDEDDDDLLNHYDIDFSKAKPNRFAAQFGSMKSGGRAIYLIPEVASQFADSEEVNRVLKTLLEVMPPRRKKPASRAVEIRVRRSMSGNLSQESGEAAVATKSLRKSKNATDQRCDPSRIALKERVLNKILRSLLKRGPLKRKDLIAEGLTDSDTPNKHCEYLRQKGLITRERGERGAYVCALTTKGKKIAERLS